RIARGLPAELAIIFGDWSVNIRTRLNGAAAPIALCVALTAQPVLAQDEESAAEVAAAAEQQAEGAVTTADNGQAIIVTGTRIRAVTPFNSPDPVTIINPEIARREGRFDIASTLQSSPIAAGSTQITSAIS